MRTTLPEPWLSIRKYYGTKDKMLKYMGISRQTFRQWVTIKTRRPSQAARTLLNLFLEAHGYPAQEWPPVDPIHRNFIERKPCNKN